MRNFLLLFLLCVLTCCKGTKELVDNTDLGLFIMDKLNNGNVLLSKKKSSLKNHSEVRTEDSYSLEAPSTLEKINSVVSIMPNEHELIFNSGQKVYIIGNRKSINVNKTGISREEFNIELQKGYIFDSRIMNLKLKRDRYFGICSNEKYILIYANVKQRNISIYNKVIKKPIANKINNNSDSADF